MADMTSLKSYAPKLAKLLATTPAALYERKLVLVRPDGHVAWRGDIEPADPLEIIDRVRGA